MKNERPFGTKIPRPSLSELVFVVWAIVIPLVFPHRLLSGDGDPARHIRLGQLMLERGEVLHTDVFSWTRAGEPFVAFEWGSEVFFALAHALGGLAGVAIAAGLILSLSFALLCRFLLARGVEPVLAYLAVVAATVMSSAHWIARPHLFTFLGVALLLPLLEDAKPRRSAWAVPLFLAWCNLHGGFVYGLVLTGTYLAGDLLEALRRVEREKWLARARAHSLILLLGSAATIANPNGLELHRHVRDFFRLSLLLEVTDEFKPPDFTTLSGGVMAGFIVLVILAFVFSKRWPTWDRGLVIASNLAFSLRARRNLVLFGFVGFPLAALQVDSAWRSLPDLGGIRATFARDQARSRPGPWSVVVVIILLALAANHGKVGGVAVVSNELDPTLFPVAAVERARQEGLQGRLFHDVTWGGYVLLAWPEQRVFLDGGTDHYGEDLVAEAIAIAQLDPGWEARLDDMDVSLVLLPPETLLVHRLVETGRWDTWFCDETAALVARRSGPGRPAPSTPTFEGCPGAS